MVKLNEKDILSLIIMALIICILALVMYAPKYEDNCTSPVVSVEILNSDLGIDPYILGCDWFYEDKGYKEKIPYAVNEVNLVEFELNKSEKAETIIKYDKPLTKIRIKVFPEEYRNDYSKGILISEDREFICTPGYTYAIEVEFGANKRMYAFKCVLPHS